MSCTVRILSLILALALLAGALFGCQKRADRPRTEIVCTTFAAFDWVRTLLGERDALQATLLIDDGSDLHSYQPTVADKVTLAEAALVVAIGGESDRWVAEMAEGTPILMLSTIDGIVLRTAETESDEAHGHDHEHEHVHEHHGEDEHDHAGFDEHLWLSPRNASVAVSALTDAICALDGAGEETYRQNEAAYLAALDALDGDIAAACAAAPRRELLVADRFPFVYLVKEYGLAYCAAFSGCSTEAQASFDTVVRLAKQADAWQLSCLLVTEGNDRRLAGSVIAATASQSLSILTLDSMQAVSSGRAASGVTYLSIMYENLEVLKVALA